MRIALVADTFPPARTSGAIQVRDLATELVRQGHEVTVMVPDESLTVPWRAESVEGVVVLRLKAPRIKNVSYVRRSVSEFLMPYYMRRNLKRSQYSEHVWDGVVWYSPSIFFGPLISWLKRRGGSKGYLILRDIFPDWAADLGLLKREGAAFRLFNSIAQGQYRLADIIGVQSRGNLDFFEEWEKSSPGRSVEVLANWLGAPRPRRCRLKLEATQLAFRKVLVYAGNLGIAQNIDVFIELAARMRWRTDVGFLFVGRGSEALRLRGDAERRGLRNVAFLDEIDPDELPDLLSQCHAGIVALDPRHRSHNIPGKFLVYLQNGLPVLANVNRNNDIASFIRENGVGKVCETNSLEDLEAACDSLLSALSEPVLSRRCKDVFDREFSAERAARQVASALK